MLEDAQPVQLRMNWHPSLACAAFHVLLPAGLDLQTPNTIDLAYVAEEKLAQLTEAGAGPQPEQRQPIPMIAHAMLARLIDAAGASAAGIERRGKEPGEVTLFEGSA